MRILFLPKILASVGFVAVYKDSKPVPHIDALALRAQVTIAQHERDPRFLEASAWLRR